MKDIYGNDIMSTIKITPYKEYIGIVVDNSDWEKNKRIKVFIPELFPFYSEPRKLGSTTESYFINDESFKLKTDIGIISKQVKINNVLVKPDIKDKVTVKFIDGDVKKCVFYMYDYSYGLEEDNVSDI